MENSGQKRIKFILCKRYKNAIMWETSQDVPNTITSNAFNLEALYKVSDTHEFEQ